MTRAGIVASVVVIAAAAVCVRLGFWQLDRLDERRARNAALYGRMSAPPLSLGSVPADTSGVLSRRIVISGTYDEARSMVVAGRAHRGVPGVYVVTPLRLGSGAVLVERGWLPSPDGATVDLEPIARAGRQTVEGLALPLLDTEETARMRPFQRIWLRHDTEMATQLPYETAPFYVRALPDTARAVAYPRRLPPPELDEGSHLSYAIQWFSFAAIALIGWLSIALRSPLRQDHPTR
ncbi:MAG: SURF1 family protein [Longimicrobiales bacterium]